MNYIYQVREIENGVLGDWHEVEFQRYLTIRATSENPDEQTRVLRLLPRQDVHALYTHFCEKVRDFYHGKKIKKG